MNSLVKNLGSPINWSNATRVERDTAISRPALTQSAELSRKVSEIIETVKRKGDSALRDYSRQFDGIEIENFRITENEVRDAYKALSPLDLAAMKEGIERIEAFHRAQLPLPLRVETAPGVVCERIYRPVGRVGLYIPGGTAPLPSTVFMLGVPSKVAGCPVRVLVTPPGKNGGKIEPAILVAADLLGIKDIFRAGGAQAIAALAYGTESIPKVDKIFGPGNSWVTEAKIQVSQDVFGAANDLPAGPSEVLVIGDDGADTSFIASDLLSQAEHGEDSQVVFISTSEDLINGVEREIGLQLVELPRQEIARAALRNSRCILVKNLDEAGEVSNAYAPEHLILQVRNPRELLKQIENAGSIFLGAYSPESVGDYASGTNHVLPTYGFARTWSGVTTESFLKSISVQELTVEGLQAIGPGVERLAELEGLRAHRNAVSIRLRALSEKNTDAGRDRG